MIRVALLLAIITAGVARHASATGFFMWSFWPGETAETMVLDHQYLATVTNSELIITMMLTPTCDDMTRTCSSQYLTLDPGTYTATVQAWWDSVQMWSGPSVPMVVTIGDPPPPPPPTCVSDGTLYNEGDTITATMRQGLVDKWLSTHLAAGWRLVSQTKVKNQTTLTMVCG